MLEETLTKLFADNATLKIATTDGEPSPWIAAAFFASEGPFTLDVMLEARGRTLANIQARPDVAVMIENGDAFALFGQGHGRATVADGEEARMREAIVAKTPSSASLMGIPDLVPVRIEIDRWRLRDVGAGWIFAKELVR